MRERSSISREGEIVDQAWGRDDRSIMSEESSIGHEEGEIKHYP
jgi:hypothetical protein